MKLRDLILEFRMAQNKDRRECSACGGTFIPDNPETKLEKRCHACRTLEVQKGADSVTNIEDLLNGKLDERKIRKLIGSATTYELEDITKQDLEKLITDMFGELNTREEHVLRLRFGLNAEKDEFTFNEISELLGLPVPRIKRIESSAIKKLKQPNVSSKLKKYLEQ